MDEPATGEGRDRLEHKCALARFGGKQPLGLPMWPKGHYVTMPGRVAHMIGPYRHFPGPAGCGGWALVWALRD